ncbi:MAG: hypothetical protein ACAH95_13765 [Fimbriimonas sp.]
MGWHELENGDLISAAEAAGFDAMVTTDKNLQYQQSLTDRKVSIIVLAPRFVFFEDLVPLLDQLKEIMANLSQGSFIVIESESD